MLYKQRYRLYRPETFPSPMMPAGGETNVEDVLVVNLYRGTTRAIANIM